MALATEYEVVERTSTSLIEQDALTEQDIDNIKTFQRFLQKTGPNGAMLVSSNGETIEIPAPIARMLGRIVPLMADGATIGFVPVQQELTAQQAADLLNISRLSLTRLFDTNEIPNVRSEGGHRHIRFVDVMRYKQQRSETRHAAFAEMAAVGEAYDAYALDADDGLFDIDTEEADDGRE